MPRARGAWCLPAVNGLPHSLGAGQVSCTTAWLAAPPPVSCRATGPSIHTWVCAFLHSCTPRAHAILIIFLNGFRVATWFLLSYFWWQH